MSNSAASVSFVSPIRRSRWARSAPVGLLTVSVCLLSACAAKSDGAVNSAPPTTVAVTAQSPASSAPEKEPKPAGSTPSTANGTDRTTRAPRTTETTETTESAPTTTAAGAGCRTVDLGGITVSVDCDAAVPDPESGVTLTKDSVYGLPGESFEELADVDATNRVVSTPDGKPVVIYLLGSDTLFDVGSSTVKSTAEAALPAVIASITKRAPNAKILVRGFTDSTGSAASNQTLSEQRAASMVDWLAGGGLTKSRMEASGYGSTKPAAEENSEFGSALNRRIEIVAVG